MRGREEKEEGKGEKRKGEQLKDVDGRGRERMRTERWREKKEKGVLERKRQG